MERGFQVDFTGLRIVCFVVAVILAKTSLAEDFIFPKQ